MKLSIGIVGLPNVGKSTLFKVITKQDVHIANYPFATIDPNVGIVPVPDARLEKLAAMSKSKKIVPAVVEFYDIAGLVKGANTGEGLGNQFLSHIRETQAIVIVLRVFKDSDIIHVENSVDSLRDFGIINTELALKDLETIEKRLAKLESDARSIPSGQAKNPATATGKKAVKDLEVLRRAKDELNKNSSTLAFREEEIVRELQLLTAKKRIYLLNGEEADIPPELLQKIQSLGAEYIVINLAGIEAIPDLIAKAYETLGLISFFTTGEDETRAWTIQKGSKAPEAAGAIHTDFEKNFIRAEVIACDKLLEAPHSTLQSDSGQASSGQGGWAQAKQKGWLRVEGKEYIVADGDVMVIRHG